MTKIQIAVEIHLMSGGDAITASDAVVSGVGSAVVAALVAGKDLHFNNGTNEYIIPYHAVAYATVTRTSATVEAPADALCVPVE